MNISKVENFNKYFQKFSLIILLLSLNLIPWIEFINTNITELDFILNDNLIILLVLYFFFVCLIYVIFSLFTSLKKYSLISFISISIWIFFQHSFLKSNINTYLKSIDVSNEYSSEIALILILSMIYLFYFFIKKKKFFCKFFFNFFNLQSFFFFHSICNRIKFFKKYYKI